MNEDYIRDLLEQLFEIRKNGSPEEKADVNKVFQNLADGFTNFGKVIEGVKKDMKNLEDNDEV